VSIRGSVDQITTEGAHGWAFDSTTGEPMTVQALYDGRIIGEAFADRHRHDLAAAGFGDGRCGFEVVFYEKVDASLLPFISVRPRGGDVELPRYAATGFADFFRGLHARHPGAGRSRSVFGGLWTDRTDARQLLAGRVAAGTAPADLAAPLAALIDNGHLVLRGAAALAGLDEAKREAIARQDAGRPIPAGEREALGALAELIFRDAVIRPLRVALDDQPICTRAVPSRDPEADFIQASAAEALPSPAECVLVVAVTGGEAVLDVIRDSHAMPEFTGEGRSRWLGASTDAVVALAQSGGLSVESAELTPADLAIVGPGTLHRLRAAPGATAIRAWILPRRVTPTRFLSGTAGLFSLRHPTGATLAA
jgi:hypothetical protein